MGRLFGGTPTTSDQSQGIGRLSQQGAFSSGSQSPDQGNGLFDALKKMVMPSFMPQSTSNGINLSDVQDTRNAAGKKTTSVWTPLDYLLNSTVYAGAGAVESGFKKAKAIRAEESAGQNVPLSRKILEPNPLNPTNWGGAIENLKPENRKTAFEVTQQQLPNNPAAAGVSLVADLAAPTVPLGRLAKLAQLDKAASTVGKIPVVSKALSETSKVVAPIFQYRGGQPAAYAEQADAALNQAQQGIEKGKELAKGLTEGFSQGEQQRMGQIMKGGVSVSPQEAKLREAVQPARQELDTLSKQVVDQAQQGNVPITNQTMQTITANMGKYMPTLYRKYEKDPEGLVKFLSTGSGKIVMDRFKNKQDIPQEVKQAMGEILEPGYPVGKAVAQMHETVAKAKLFRWVGDNFAQAENATGDLVQLAPDARYGMLAGKYLPKEIANDIQGITIPKEKFKLGSVEVEKIYDKLLGAWKTGKVVMNPAALARNQMSNMVLMNVVGDVPMHQVLNPALWIDAGKELVNQGGLYHALKNETDLLGSTMYGNEIAPFLDAFEHQSGGNAFQRFSNAVSQVGGKAGDIYNAVEQISKIAMVKHLLSEGKTLKEAARMTEEALFNYSKVPKVVKALRKVPLGFPFITFAYKATPAVAKAVINRPQKLAQLTRVGKAVESQATQQNGPANKDMLPDYMQGQYLRLPFQEKGQDLYLDLNYILPWGNLSGFSGEPTNPVYTLMADLNRNKSSFTQKEIWKDTDDDKTKQGKAADYMYKALMPALSPSIPGTDIKGGYSWQKLVDSGLFGGQQRPDYFNRLRNKPTVLADVFAGLKMTPIDYNQTAAIKQGNKRNQIQSLQNDIKTTSRDNRLFPAEKKNKIQYDQQRIQAITQQP